MSSRVSLITTCKNRLHHLQQTLPLMARQSATEVIVVDYGCQQGTGSWVREHYPQVRVLVVADSPDFCAARARNQGAAAASGDYLFFVDADIFLHQDVGLWASQNICPGAYYRAPLDKGLEAWGTFLCRREDFVRAGGYDEAFRLWGGEDLELYGQLDTGGLTMAPLPEGCLSVISHGDDERQLGALKSRQLMIQVHRVYCLAKEDIAKLTGQVPDLDSRMALMDLIHSQVERYARAQGKKHSRIEIRINHGIKGHRDVRLERTLTYTLSSLPMSSEEAGS